MLLEIKNVTTKILGKLDLDTRKDLERDLTFTYETDEGEVEECLLDRDNSFPTGCYSIVDKVLTENRKEFDIQDARSKIERGETIRVMGKTRRDYQEKVTEDAINQQRGVIKIATGGGKTTVAGMIIGTLNVDTLFITGTCDLMYQGQEELSSMLGVDVGIVGDGKNDIKKVTVATVQTVHRALGLAYQYYDKVEKEYDKKQSSDVYPDAKRAIVDKVKNAKLVIVDECHHLQANSYVNMMKETESAYYKFGMSGTPYRLDGRDLLLQAHSGKQICDINASFLIKRGFLVTPYIKFINPNKTKKYQHLDAGWHEVSRRFIEFNYNRNDIAIDDMADFKEEERPFLVTVNTVRHGKLLEKEFNSRYRGINIKFVHGAIEAEQRKKYFEWIMEGKLDGIIGTTLADEGLDIPCLSGAIFCGGGRSWQRVPQRLGRTLRIFPGKNDAKIRDFYDNVRYLRTHSGIRKFIYESEEEFQIDDHPFTESYRQSKI